MKVEFLVRKDLNDQGRIVGIDLPDRMAVMPLHDATTTDQSGLRVYAKEDDIASAARAIQTFIAQHGGITENFFPIKLYDNNWAATVISKYIIEFAPSMSPKIFD